MKKDNLDTRAEKIKLLNDLKTGKVNINEVFPALPEHWVYEKSKRIYSRGNKELSEKEFKVLKARKEKICGIVIWEIKDPIGDDHQAIKMHGKDDTKRYDKTQDNPPPLDEKQLNKICSALRNKKNYEY